MLQRFIERTEARARSSSNLSNASVPFPGFSATSNVVTVKSASTGAQESVGSGSVAGPQPCNTDFPSSKPLELAAKPESPPPVPVSVHVSAGNISSSSQSVDASFTENPQDSAPSHVSTPTRDGNPDSDDDLRTPSRDGQNSMDI